MSRPTKKTGKRMETSSAEGPEAVQDHAHDSGPCPRCQALEARVAELESAAERITQSQSSTPNLSKNLPQVDFKALG